ncbi:hypothetical protein [Methylocucumis oryzae]|uniref:hypothetical protein n=1 Tax=Methylocucumis oryzae TaxID=1632867 RepID=UPI0006960142|nr:hypothetical protein [Methylocucumis oryzae]
MNQTIIYTALTLLIVNSTQTLADVVTADDIIVQGSGCFGFDCVNNETFGAETIRLKENNLRIGIDDTSTGSFPANDWQLTFNDQASGGANKFSVEDITNSTVPFTLIAGAPTNSLFVSSLGNIGLGTSSPTLKVHLINSNTPAIRLEQDNGNGFTAQTWDLGANEVNFFIRDVTGGNSLPFRIRPGAPTSSLAIAESGNVGLGTISPSAKLHLSSASDTNKVLVENTSQTQAARELIKLSNNGGSYITMYNKATNQSWYFTHENSAGTSFNITHDTTAGAALRLTTAGNLRIKGTLTTAGSCSGGCDIVFSKDYKLPSIEEHAEQMWQNSYLPAVGQTKEGEPFNISEKTGAMLNELEKAHIYIAQLNQKLAQTVKQKDNEITMITHQLKAKNQELDLVKNQISLLEKRLDKIEQH